MSPELQRLLEAFYEKLSCPPEEKPQRVATRARYLRHPDPPYSSK